jgi:hypothetical protein
MSARDDEIRRVVAELDVHIAEVEASVAVLKSLLADGEVPAEEDPRLRWEPACKRVDAPSFSLLHSRTRAGHLSMRPRADLQGLGR